MPRLDSVPHHGFSSCIFYHSQVVYFIIFFSLADTRSMLCCDSAKKNIKSDINNKWNNYHSWCSSPWDTVSKEEKQRSWHWSDEPFCFTDPTCLFALQISQHLRVNPPIFWSRSSRHVSVFDMKSGYNPGWDMNVGPVRYKVGLQLRLGSTWFLSLVHVIPVLCESWIEIPTFCCVISGLSTHQWQVQTVYNT